MRRAARSHASIAFGLPLEESTATQCSGKARSRARGSLLCSTDAERKWWGLSRLSTENHSKSPIRCKIHTWVMTRGK